MDSKVERCPKCMSDNVWRLTAASGNEDTVCGQCGHQWRRVL